MNIASVSSDSLLTLVLVFGVPIILLNLERRIPLINWLSPAFWCYAVGIGLGIGWNPDTALAQTITEAVVVLALPLLLFSANIKDWFKLAPKVFLSWILWVIAIWTMTILGFFIWESVLATPDAVAGMASSVYIGGTVNMAAVQVAISAPPELFVQMNLTDILVSVPYLLLMLTIGRKFYQLFLPPYDIHSLRKERIAPEAEMRDVDHTSYHIHSAKERFKYIVLSLTLSIVILGIVVGLSLLIDGKLDEVFILVGLTIMGLAASAIGRIRSLPASYETGEFLFLVFCVAVGTQVDVQALKMNTLDLLLYLGLIVYGGIALHTLLARICKLDSDTVLITGIAGVMGPPFIGPAANALKNKEIVVTGLTLSVINLAIGNFSGILIFNVL